MISLIIIAVCIALVVAISDSQANDRNREITKRLDDANRRR